jgi:choline-sulfatase
MPEPPNVLFLMTDQLRADSLGFAGDDTVRTPNIDALAEDAAIFENAYSPSPVCIPGRQALMAGQLPTTCGCYSYGMDLDPGYQTFARQFAEAGYMTTCAGKLHHRGFDQMQGWRRRIGYDTYVGGPGFDAGPGETGIDQTDEAIERYVSAPGVDRTGLATTNQWQRAGGGRSEQVRRDEYAVQGALEYVRENLVAPYESYGGPSDRPQLFKLSLEQPHPPFVTEEERFEYYLNRVDPYVDEPDHPLEALQPSGQIQSSPGDLTPREVRRATAAYYGMIEAADDHVGTLLDALEDAGVDLEEWIVVFTADHGEHLGQHNLWAKTNFTDAACRVPLFVRWPDAVDAGRIDANVSLCDLYATLCSLADVETPAGLDSRDLTPLLTGEATTEDWARTWDDEAIAELDGERVMIKRGDLKYVYDRETEDEFLLEGDDHDGVPTDHLEDDAYAETRAAFRARRDDLGYAPDGDPLGTTSGYARV